MKNILVLFIIIIITTFKQESTNYCINGINLKYLNNKDYLIEFSKGNCSPVIIIPPLTGTRLYI